MAVTDVSRQLVFLFFASNALKKDKGVNEPVPPPRDVHKLAVLGAGFTALSGAATLTAITKEQLDTDKANAGKLLFPAGKGEYYVVDG